MRVQHKVNIRLCASCKATTHSLKLQWFGTLNSIHANSLQAAPCVSAYKSLITQPLLIDDYFAGVGYRPKPSMDHVESTLLHFRHGDLGNWESWVERLDTFLTGKPNMKMGPRPRAWFI